MRTIHKFSIPAIDYFEVQLPATAQVLSVQMQRGIACMWVLLDTNAQYFTRRFRLAGTGHQLSAHETLSFIGTFQPTDGLVFHLFEVK